MGPKAIGEAPRLGPILGATEDSREMRAPPSFLFIICNIHACLLRYHVGSHEDEIDLHHTVSSLRSQAPGTPECIQGFVLKCVLGVCFNQAQ